ncbi:hypothetical protein BH10ACT1_BH10ACT1_04020 [soil metagenome]
MSAAIVDPTPPSPALRVTPGRITVARAGLALVWAAAIVVAVGNRVPTTDTDLPVAAAFLFSSYPLIDVVASLVGSAFADRRALRINAAVSAVAAIGIAAAAFGSDAGSTLVAFGAWAAVSGAIQLGLALHRRRTLVGQLPMIVSGGLSTLAGLSFIAASQSDEAQLANLAGYMVFGAVLYLVWARRSHADPTVVEP